MLICSHLDKVCFDFYGRKHKPLKSVPFLSQKKYFEIFKKVPLRNSAVEQAERDVKFFAVLFEM